LYEISCIVFLRKELFNDLPFLSSGKLLKELFSQKRALSMTCHFHHLYEISCIVLLRKELFQWLAIFIIWQVICMKAVVLFFSEKSSFNDLPFSSSV
jgi:hypothetical protein